MKNLLSVTIDNSPKILKFIINEDKNIELGQKVVVESERGITIADVKKKVAFDEKNNNKIPEVIRVANSKDLYFLETKEELEFNAKQYCLERIIYRNMKMKIVDVKYMLHASKVIFYFTADGRVDFRALVKDLASSLKSRIEMRQIGVRDHAQIVGGIGICGRELCCHSFMSNFLPVSLDDAKKNGTGNSDKLIGVCGRFMCCLKFEGESEKCKSCDKKPAVDSIPGTEGKAGGCGAKRVNNNNSKPMPRNNKPKPKVSASTYSKSRDSRPKNNSSKIPKKFNKKDEKDANISVSKKFNKNEIKVDNHNSKLKQSSVKDNSVIESKHNKKKEN